MFKINKWHKGKSGKGYVVELCFYDEETKEWHNAKMYIPDAAQYAGNDSDTMPAALAGVSKDGALVIKCYRKDTFTETPYKDKANKKASQEQLPDPSQAKGKGKGKAKAKTIEALDDDEDIPF